MDVLENAIETWVQHGLPCAIRLGMWGVCGYVQLPPNSADRRHADAFHVEEELRLQLARELHGLPDYGPVSGGYDALQDVGAPGGFTYGPDEDGWIGFDTGHAFDRWHPDEIRRLISKIKDEALREHSLSLLQTYLDVGVPIYGIEDDDARRWTYEALRAAVADVAEQFAARLAKETAPKSED